MRILHTTHTCGDWNMCGVPKSGGEGTAHISNSYQDDVELGERAPIAGVAVFS